MSDEEADEFFDPDEADEDDDEDEGPPRARGHDRDQRPLAVHAHGREPAEREVGQRLLVDIRLDVGECDATVTDRIEDTVDYGEVCESSTSSPSSAPTRRSSASARRSADRLLEQYEAHAVWVKAAKPEPPIALPVSEVSVEVWREA